MALRPAIPSSIFKENRFNMIYCYNRVIGLMSRVFANGPEDWRSIPDRVIPKTKKKKKKKKMVLDAA